MRARDPRWRAAGPFGARGRRVRARVTARLDPLRRALLLHRGLLCRRCGCPSPPRTRRGTRLCVCRPTKIRSQFSLCVCVCATFASVCDVWAQNVFKQLFTVSGRLLSLRAVGGLTVSSTCRTLAQVRRPHGAELFVVSFSATRFRLFHRLDVDSLF